MMCPRVFEFFSSGQFSKGQRAHSVLLHSHLFLLARQKCKDLLLDGLPKFAGPNSSPEPEAFRLAVPLKSVPWYPFRTTTAFQVQIGNRNSAPRFGFPDSNEPRSLFDVRRSSLPDNWNDRIQFTNFTQESPFSGPANRKHFELLGIGQFAFR